MRTRTVIAVSIVLVLMLSLVSPLGCSEATETSTATPTPTPPAFPHLFYGELHADGTPAPVGTLVEAKVNGEVRGSIISTEAGIYATLELRPLLVQGDIEEGATIEFYADGVKCNEIGIFQAGGHTELDLTYAP
jgi:hypothetical protein